MGVEASTEIQSAARRVLEENRRLRAILRSRGVPEAEIAAALRSYDRPIDHTSAAPTLNTMLERKLTCVGLSPCDSFADSESRYASTVSQTPEADVAPLVISSQPAIACTANEANSPVSIISSTGTSPSFTSAPLFPAEITPVPEIKTEGITQYYNFDQTPNNPWMYANDQTYAVDASSYYNTTSCVDAANIIRTMRSDVGLELEADFGCRMPGQDCRVSNPLIFNMMEKYRI
jgi:hypothetical protein